MQMGCVYNNLCVSGLCLQVTDRQLLVKTELNESPVIFNIMCMRVFSYYHFREGKTLTTSSFIQSDQ